MLPSDTISLGINKHFVKIYKFLSEAASSLSCFLGLSIYYSKRSTKKFIHNPNKKF